MKCKNCGAITADTEVCGPRCADELEQAKREHCPARDDGTHCVCWWDGAGCCSCGDGAEEE